MRIQADDLRRLCRKLLERAGLRAPDAKLVADSLVTANLRGTDSHGVARLPHYLARIRNGSIAPRPRIRVVRSRRAIAVVDGGHGMGQLANQFALAEAIRRARRFGAGWVAIRNSSHCGALAYFGQQIARANMIGLVFSHVDPMVLPFGARRPFHGTNPICITLPGRRTEVFCLDMATSIVPWNVVANAAIEGKSIARGLAVDLAGRETTNPRRVAALYPFGAHRGSGLGLAIDLLCAMLSDSPFGPHIPKMYGDLKQRRRLGGLVGAIDIAAFTDVRRFKRRVGQFMRELRALPPAVLAPNDPEKRRFAERSRKGIPLPEPVWNELNKLRNS